MINKDRLTFWTDKSLSTKKINEEFNRLKSESLLIKLDFNGSSQPEVSLTRTPKLYLFETINVIKQIAPSLENLTGSIIISLEDGLTSPISEEVPVLTFSHSKNDPFSELIPEPHFMNTEGYFLERRILDVSRKKIPWKQKAKTAFWRGVSTGTALTESSWRNNTRVKLASMAKELSQPTLLDASMSRIVQLDEHLPLYRRILEEGLVSGTVPFDDFLKFRYLIEVDGNLSTWSSMFRKLYANSLMLKVESNYLLWYSEQLEAFKHFLPVAADLSNLLDTISWALSHDEECRQISDNATQAATAITFPAALDYVRDRIQTILAAQSHI